MNKYLTIAIIVTVLGEALNSKTSAQPPNCIANSLPAVTKPANSNSQDNVIVIGRVAARPYVVVVPNQSVTALNIAKKYNNYAFLAQHKLGLFIYAGGFVNRKQAECLSNLLRDHG
ncbi:hypothetical protein PN474_16185, partial [Nodularia spumigena CS-589/07]